MSSIFQKILTWRFSRVWNRLCYPSDLGNNKVFVKGMSALKVNNRMKAARIWERYQRKSPADYRLTHNLALLYYWGASFSKKNPNPNGKREQLWKKAIANWVMLLNADEFWKEWKEKRQPFYFKENISVTDVDELRRDLTVLMEREIPQSQEIDLLLERKTSEIFRHLKNWGRRRGLNSSLPICGLLMLKQLGKLNAARRLAELGTQIESSNDDFRRLLMYLQPLGNTYVLLEDKRLEEALAELGKIPDRNQMMSQEFRKEFVDTCLKWANQAQDIETKFNRLEKAIGILPDEILKFALEEGKRDEALRLNKKSIQRANELLESESKMIENDDLKGLRKVCSKFENEVLPELMKAFDLDPSSDLIGKNLQAIKDEIASRKEYIKLLEKFGTKRILELLSEAREAADNSQWDNAVKLLRNALGLAKHRDGIKEINQELACYLNAQAVERANELLEKANNYVRNKNLNKLDNLLHKLENECLPKLREASELDPSNENIRRNLSNLEEQLKQIKQVEPIADISDSDFDLIKSLLCPSCRCGRLNLTFASSRIKLLCQTCGFEVKLK